jgi:RND family efflux transporter MFP subunit
MKSIKVKLGSIEKKQLTSSLKANGTLKVPNQNRATATTILGGIVKSIMVQTGNVVHKGQVIATITNPSFIAMQEDYLNASAKADLAELELARQKQLQQGNAGALKSLQSAETELKILKNQRSSLKKQLEMIGINAGQLTAENIQSAVNIVSPLNGAISNVMMNIGTYADMNAPIAEIVDNSQLHLDLYVYEKDLQKLRKGQTIHFTLTNNPGQEYDADVYAISNTFESSTKAIAVHAMVKGNKDGLIDGMSITALVSLDKATVDAVPSDAIVSSEGLDYIFVVAPGGEKEEEGHEYEEHGHVHEAEEKAAVHDKGTTTFEKIPVRKGTSDVGYSEITLLKEIPKGALVVTNGAFFILAKMNNKGEAHQH